MEDADLPVLGGCEIKRVDDETKTWQEKQLVAIVEKLQRFTKRLLLAEVVQGKGERKTLENEERGKEKGEKKKKKRDQAREEGGGLQG